MTDKDKIRAEIERQINLNNNIDPITTSQELVVDSVNVVLTDLLDYIVSLPEDPVSEDLDWAAKWYAIKHPNIPCDIIDKVIPFFKAGAQWQKNQTIDKTCAWLKENIYHRVYEQGDRLGFPTAEFIKDFRKAMEDE